MSAWIAATLAAAALLAEGKGGARRATRPAPAVITECYTQGSRQGCVVAPRAARKGPTHALVLFLHGYGGSGDDDTLGLAGPAGTDGALYLYAQGVPDALGRRTWQDIDSSTSKAPSHADAQFLDWLLGQAEAHWSVDPKRISVAGWSLGGFMALQFACESTRAIASVVSYAGGIMADAAGRCAPVAPLSILLLHGDADDTIAYAGGLGARTGQRYQSAASVFDEWSHLVGCAGEPQHPGERLDLHAAVLGQETSRARADGCPEGVAVELWTVEGGGHHPDWTPTAPALVWSFLHQHPGK